MGYIAVWWPHTVWCYEQGNGNCKGERSHQTNWEEQYPSHTSNEHTTNWHTPQATRAYGESYRNYARHSAREAEAQSSKQAAATYDADGFTHLSDNTGVLLTIGNHFYKQIKGK